MQRVYYQVSIYVLIQTDQDFTFLVRERQCPRTATRTAVTFLASNHHNLFVSPHANTTMRNETLALRGLSRDKDGLFVLVYCPPFSLCLSRFLVSARNQTVVKVRRGMVIEQKPRTGRFKCYKNHFQVGIGRTNRVEGRPGRLERGGGGIQRLSQNSMHMYIPDKPTADR